MNIIQSILTRNECYQAGRKITVRGLMVHSTACPGVPSKNFVSSWNTPRPNGSQVCVHAFMDPGTVYQTLPWNHRAWHCGGSGNNDLIGIEWCEPSNYADRAYFEEIRETGVELYASLCKQYGLSASDIVSHKEGHRRGIASNHGDPDHWWRYVGYSMDQFRADVQAKLNGGSISELPSVPSTGGGVVNTGTATSYDAIVVPNIGVNVRKGPGTNYSKITALPKGTQVHISKESNGWGFNGTGWILTENLSRVSGGFSAYNATVVPNIGVNVRKGPGTNYGKITALPKGTVVRITKEQNGWGYNGTGWIKLENLRRGGSVSSGGSGSKYGTGNYTVTVTLKVRTGAGLNYRQKRKSELTADGQRHANANGCLRPGTVVTVSQVVKLSVSYWGKIPSGWICLEMEGEKYVRR